jgi:translation elongation factor EF-G
MYSLTNDENSMDFPTFAFFFHYHRLFNKYSIKRPLLLTQDELLNLLRDEVAPKEVLFAIDSSFTNFNQSQYLEASLVLQRRRLNEKTFFSFMEQDASVRTNATEIKSTIKADYLTLEENVANRKVFFNTMLGLYKQFWSKTDFYRAFIISNLYVSLRDVAVKHNVGVLLGSLQSQYDQVSPSINQELRKNYIFYKSLPSDVDLDLLSFLSLENFTYKIENHRFTAASTIEETLLKTCMKDIGMKAIPDTVIDLAKTGYDSIRRRIFNALDVVKYIMIVHSAAVDRARTNYYYKTYKLAPNADNTRLYPDQHRKFLSSPLV